MPITKLKIKPASKSKTYKYVVEYDHTRVDSMGKWEGSGSYLQIYSTCGFLVGQNLRQEPILVVKNLDELIEKLKSIHPGVPVEMD